jgi:hypothetical protein
MKINSYVMNSIFKIHHLKNRIFLIFSGSSPISK